MSTLVLENAVVMRILKNAAFVNKFPFIRTASLKLHAKGKKPCCGRKKRANTLDLNAFKMAIDNLPLDQKKDFKAMLNVEAIRLHYVSPSGQNVKSTI
jgi:hypothetical protein